MGCGSSRAAAADGQAGQQEGPPLVAKEALVNESPIRVKEAHADSDVAWAQPESPVPPAGAAAVAQPVSVSSTGGQAASVMQKVKQVLQDLNGIHNDGSRAALAQAAAVLLKHLDFADAIGLTACVADSHVSILGGAAGVGSEAMQKRPIHTDSSYSDVLCSSNAASTPYLYHTVKGDKGVAGLPPDWAALYKEEGLSSFLAVAVSSATGVVGVMTLASKQTSAFQEAWLDPLLSMICSGLAPLLGHSLMTGLCRLAAKQQQESCRDYKAYVKQLMEACSQLLLTATNLEYKVRLGLMSEAGEKMLVMHVVEGVADVRLSTDSGVTGPFLGVSVLPARETVMWEALTSKGARLVADTRQYMEALVRPGLDVFLEGQQSISSLVVIPFKFADGSSAVCRGGVYVASTEPGDFAESKRAIVSTVSLVQWLLEPHVQQGGVLASACADMQTSKVSSSGRLPQKPTAGANPAGASQDPVHARSAAGLMQLLQQQVRSSQAQLETAARARGPLEYIQELELQRVIGKGGFGTVYQGNWKGSPAAVKVMVVPSQQRKLMKAALEMAVQESLSHPNIVRVYAIFTDVIQDCVPDSDSGSGSLTSSTQQLLVAEAQNPSSLRFRHAGPDDPDTRRMTCNIMIMELCDFGSLHTAIQKGLLHGVTAAGVTVVNMRRLLLVLLDIARSLQHIHAQSLIHCDLKPANVLLKSGTDSPLGFVCKLADFGLVKWMNGRMYVRNKSVSGTVTHLAPERFQTGTRLTSAVDIYAFGMIMYEAYTRKRPFADLRPAAMVQAVLNFKRPNYSSGVPMDYQRLTEVCWAQNAEDRPTAEAVVGKLQEMLQQCDVIGAQQSQSKNSS